MDPIFEKIEKLKELSKSRFNEASDEGRLFLSMIDVLDDIYDRLKALEKPKVSSISSGINEDLEENKEEPDFSYTVVCPFCEEEIDITEDMVDDFEINCPKCGNRMPVLPDDLFSDF
ncbi:MAG: hypothetical protein VB120_06955 [Lachnospiraceae bacterium]|nr:hypothetical protein [Lachnospiraceae bacterium]